MLKKHTFEIIVFLIVFVIGSIPVFFLGTMFFIDELGTIGNVAQIMGRELSGYINQEGFFYKYAQAIFYFPAFLLQNSVNQIRAMLLINSLMIAIIPVLCYRILDRYLVVKSQKTKVLISLVVGCFPASLLLSKFVWAESLLFLTTWLVLFVLLRALDLMKKEDEKKALHFNSIMLSFFLVLAFATHQRGIIVTIATIMVVILLRVIRKISLVRWISFSVSLLIFLFIDNRLTAYFRDRVLNFTDIEANTVSTSIDIEFLRSIFTSGGIRVIVRQIVGYLLSVNNGTLGLMAVGVVLTSIFICKVIAKRDKLKDAEIILIIYSLLIFIGALLVSVLFFYRAVALFYWGEVIFRSDRLIYTRYIDSVIGPFMLLTIYLMISKKIISLAAKISSTVISLILVVISAILVLPRVDGVDFWPQLMLANTLFVDLGDFEKWLETPFRLIVVENLSTSILLLSLITIVIMVLMMSIKSNKMLIMVCLVFVFNYTVNMKNIIVPINRYFSEITLEIENSLEEVRDIIEQEGIYRIYLDNPLWRIPVKFAVDDNFSVYTERVVHYTYLENVILFTNREQDISQIQFYNDVSLESINLNNLDLDRIRVYIIRYE